LLDGFFQKGYSHGGMFPCVGFGELSQG